MEIDVQKHLMETIQKLGNALDGIVRLRNNCYGNTNLEKVVDKAVEWYETDNLNAYVFFNDVFPCSMGATEFYRGLSGFLVNSILDDSCYELVWTQYDIDNHDEHAPATPWDKDIAVSVKAIWSHDDSPNRSTDAGMMLKAMEYLEEKDRQREEFDKKLDELHKRMKK